MRKLNVLVGSLLVILGACKDTPEKTRRTEVTIMIDNTEESGNRFAMVSKDALWQLIKSDDTVHSSGSIHFMQINDVSLNEEATIECPAEKDGSTRLQNKRAKERFVKALDSSYARFLGPSKDTKASSIYRPVCEAISALNKSGADKKVLIVLSDMIENSGDGNFYRVTSRSVSETIKKLEKIDSLPNNPKNMEVIILFQPKNETADAKFQNSMQVWNTLFKNHGIQFTVKANL